MEAETQAEPAEGQDQDLGLKSAVRVLQLAYFSPVSAATLALHSAADVSTLG